MRQLITTVHVHDDDGQLHVLRPGDELPAWAYDKVTNPKAFTTDNDDIVDGQDVLDAIAALNAGDATGGSALLESLSAAATEGGQLLWADTGYVSPDAGTAEAPPAETAAPAETVGVPPRSGTGSGLGAWSAYALANSVDPAGATSRDDVIARLDAAGVPTRQ